MNKSVSTSVLPDALQGAVLHDFPNAPNPRRVHIFCAEKGIVLERSQVNIMVRAQKEPEFIEKNPTGQIPVLELADGTCIAESVSICRFIEAVAPENPLFGTTALEQAQIDVWLRRVEFSLMFMIGQVWIHGHELTAGLLKQIPEAAELGRERAAAGYKLFDKALKNQQFIAGDKYTVADAVALATIDFGCGLVGVPYDEGLTNLKRWHDEVSARPSAKA
ncbi:MAG: glutathione S-transferase family protein [Alphaproteobacteria bacterium]